jgi:hypothetical protein
MFTGLVSQSQYDRRGSRTGEFSKISAKAELRKLKEKKLLCETLFQLSAFRFTSSYRRRDEAV